MIALLVGSGGVALSCAKSEGIAPQGSVSGGSAGIDGSVAAGAGGQAAGGTGGGTAGAGTGGGATGGSAGSSSGGTSGSSAGGTGGSGTGGTAGSSAGGTAGAGTGGTGGSGTGGAGGSGSCTIKSFDFASCTGGFTHGGANDDWACGVPTSGPGADHDGNGQLWGTHLSGNASTCENASLESPTIDLSAYSGQAIRLRFWHWHAFRVCNPGVFGCAIVCPLDNSQYSGGLVEVYDGSQWHKVTPTVGYNGTKINCYSNDPDAGPTCQPCDIDGQTGFGTATNGSWQYAEADISSYAVAGFKVRFHFASYDTEFLCHPNSAGWYIDDVLIAPVNCP